MGHQYPHQHHQRHQATDGLLNLFTKANHDLAVVHHRLQKEFQQVYPDNANPMKLLSRIKKIQEDISTLKGQCHELLAAKQDLIDKAQRTLVENRNLVQRMQASIGIPLAREDDAAFANFQQIIEEWTAQVRSRTGKEFQGFSAQGFETAIIEPWKERFDLALGELMFSYWSKCRKPKKRKGKGAERHDSDSGDLNKLLFSAIVQSN